MESVRYLFYLAYSKSTDFTICIIEEKVHTQIYRTSSLLSGYSCTSLAFLLCWFSLREGQTIELNVILN